MRQLPPGPPIGSQSSSVPVWAPPSSSSSRWILRSVDVGQLELAERPAASSSGPGGRSDLDPAVAAQRRRQRGRREDRRPRVHRRADEPVVDPPDPPRVQLGRGADHDHLSAPECSGDLVRAVEQPAEPAEQRSERGDVGTTDEPDRPPGRVTERQRGDDGCEGVAAGVDHDQRAAAGGQPPRAADGDAPAQPAEAHREPHQRLVAAPVVDVPRPDPGDGGGGRRGGAPGGAGGAFDRQADHPRLVALVGHYATDRFGGTRITDGQA